MPIKVVKINRDQQGLMTEIVQEEAQFDSAADYERHAFLEVVASRDQTRFNEVVRRRLETAVSGGGDWRTRGQFELDLMNAWLRAIKVPPIVVEWPGH